MVIAPRLARCIVVVVCGVAAALVWAALTTPALAQPDYQLGNILLEPHPIPADELPGYRNARRATRTITTPNPPRFSAAAPYSRFSFLNTPPAPAPVTAAASAADRANAKAAVAAYLDTITATESEAGPFSAELFEQLLSLGQAYQQLDQHDEALATLEKAEYISRINNGLYTPNQFAVVEQMVDSLIANGNMQEAMLKQQYLFYLHLQYYDADSRQLVPALEQLGDWSMQSFAAGAHSSTSVGFLASGNMGGNGFAGVSRQQSVLSPRAQAVFNLELAQRRYNQAITNLLASNDVHNAQILGLEEKLLQSIYYGAHRKGLMQNPDFYLDARVDATGSRISHPEFESNMVAFLNGRNALLRTLIYLQTNPAADPTAQLVTLLNLGDWHALFNRMFDASDYYHDAYTFAASLPAYQQQWQALLAPPVPRQLPDFIALPHSRASFGIADNAAVSFEGYIDVSLDLSRSGNVRNIELLKMTDNVTPQLSRRLRRLLRSAPFRPTLEAGEPMATDDTLVRYYFAEIREETRL